MARMKDERALLKAKVDMDTYNLCMGILAFTGKNLDSLVEDALKEFVDKYKDAIDIEKLKKIK